MLGNNLFGHHFRQKIIIFLKHLVLLRLVTSVDKFVPMAA